MASSRPRTVGAASTRRRRHAVGGLLALPALLLALALAMPGIAAAETYTETATKPSTTTPSSGVSPSKESTTATSTTTPSTSVSPTAEKASTLPFTGFDLRWDIGFGLLLMGAGFSIVLVQRRQRRAQHKR
jgi:uncharacterized iron-regulated membrane protein